MQLRREDEGSLNIFGQTSTTYRVCVVPPAGTRAGYTEIEDKATARSVIPSCPTPVTHESCPVERNLLLVLLTGVVVTTLLGGLGLLPPDTAGAAATEGRGKSKVDVLLGVETDHERGNVDDLLADAVTVLARACSKMHRGRVVGAYRMWRWRIRTRAWWIDLARPSL